MRCKYYKDYYSVFIFFNIVILYDNHLKYVINNKFIDIITFINFSNGKIQY